MIVRHSGRSACVRHSSLISVIPSTSKSERLALQAFGIPDVRHSGLIFVRHSGRSAFRPLPAVSLVLDRVRHFRPIPIHQFFAVNRCRCDNDTLQEQTWRRVTDRSKAPDAAAATNNSGGADRLQRGGGCL